MSSEVFETAYFRGMPQGSVTPSKLRLSQALKVNILRLIGIATPYKFWLKQALKVKVCLRLLSSVVPSALDQPLVEGQHLQAFFLVLFLASL
jgi:hypothetical protein